MFNTDQNIPEPELRAILETQNEIQSLDFSGMEFPEQSFSGKRFTGCCFAGAKFTEADFSGSRFRMCFFDEAVFNGCRMTNTDIQFSCFAGAKISGCDFRNSELLHDNFNGIVCENSTFNDSDLYNSRFVLSTLTKTTFENCNLKKVLFFRIFNSDSSFKYSNTREAVFSAADLHFLQTTAASIHCEDALIRYMVALTAATRPVHAERHAPGGWGDAGNGAITGSSRGDYLQYIRLGASPRAAVSLCRYAKIRAMFAGREWVSPEDVKDAAFDVFRHRITLSYEASASGVTAGEVVSMILDAVALP